MTDGKYVVAYFKSGTVAGLTTDGRELWRVNLQDKYGDDSLWWDIASSPVLAGDRVLVAVMQAGNSYLVALDLATGEVLWKVPREYECPEESDQAYASPQVVKLDGRDVLVTLGLGSSHGARRRNGQAALGMRRLQSERASGCGA